MRLAIADPPYLGRASRWYGVDGKGNARGRGRADEHVDAGEWDLPSRHRELVDQLERAYDGWAVAMSVHSLDVYVSTVRLGSSSGYRLGAWIVPNYPPSGSRIASKWEPVLFRIPDDRRTYGTGPAVTDVITAPSPRIGFAGAKPAAWTRWILDVLGYDPDTDIVADLFPGSGAVSREIAQGIIL